MNCINCNEKAEITLDLGFIKKHYCQKCHSARYGLNGMKWSNEGNYWKCDVCNMCYEKLKHAKSHKEHEVVWIKDHSGIK